MASWLSSLSNLEHALAQMKKSFEESISVSSVGTTEWCRSVEKIIDELTNAIYALKTPGWADSEQSERVKRLKRNAQEVYAKYLRAAGKRCPADSTGGNCLSEVSDTIREEFVRRRRPESPLPTVSPFPERPPTCACSSPLTPE